MDAPRPGTLLRRALGRAAVAARAARWTARVAAKGWLPVALPRLALLGLALVQLDAIVNWGLARRALAARSPAEAAAAWLALAAATALLDRRAFRDLLRAPVHGVLLRQPVGALDLGPAALGLLAPGVAPAAALGFVAHGAGGAVAWGLPAAAVLGAGAVGVGPALAAAAVGLAPVAVAQAVSPGAGAALALAAVPAVGAAWRRVVLPEAGPGAGSRLRFAHPALALLHRDWLAVRRTAPGALAAPVGWAAVIAFVVGAFRVNSGFDAAACASVALVLLAAGAWTTLAVPAAAARALGRAFDPPHWPTRARWRVASLAALAGLGLAPGWAAAAATAPLGPAEHGRIGAYVLALAFGAAWWVAARPLRPGWGSWPWYAAACLAPALAGRAWALVGVAAAAAALAARALRTARSAG